MENKKDNLSEPSQSQMASSLRLSEARLAGKPAPRVRRDLPERTGPQPRDSTLTKEPPCSRKPWSMRCGR